MVGAAAAIGWLSFTAKAEASTVLAPADQTRVAQSLEQNAEVMTNTHLDALLKDQPPSVRAEII